MGHIFKNAKVRKSGIYQFMLDKMLAAGWQNISSNAADGDVMYSKGNLDDQELFIQFFPYNILNKASNAVDISEARYKDKNDHVQTSNTNNHISVRLCKRYQPGTNSAAGEIERPDQELIVISVTNSTANVNTDTRFDVHYYVDKNKLILSIKAPEHYAGKQSQFLYVGQPDTLYMTGKDARNVLCASSSQYGVNYKDYGTRNIIAPGALRLSDYPSQMMGNYGNQYPAALKTITPTATPNTEDIFLLLEPYVDINECGICSKLDGVYLLASDADVQHGDIIKVGDSEYYVIWAKNNLSSWVSSFNAPIAFQIK